mmetsp:Transcript_89092/g.229924  ORF Transcript_89092/g.229924 Transcript_89092/m.229924 type:complete len:236 (+) Transcript_89092:191-898(+)
MSPGNARAIAFCVSPLPVVFASRRCGRTSTSRRGSLRNDARASGRLQIMGRRSRSSFSTYHCGNGSSSSPCLCMRRASEGVTQKTSPTSPPAIAHAASSASGTSARKRCTAEPVGEAPPTAGGSTKQANLSSESGHSLIPQSSRNAWNAIGPSRTSTCCNSCRAKLGGGLPAMTMPAASNVRRNAVTRSANGSWSGSSTLARAMAMSEQSTGPPGSDAVGGPRPLGSLRRSMQTE